MSGLTHFNPDGAAEMVDVSTKDVTTRIAIAEGYIIMSETAFEAVANGTAKKGDVLGVARLAGIMAAKKTSELIPLCHPLPLSKTGIEFELSRDAHRVRAVANVKTTGQTGVEMEALTAVTAALLTIYDMLKAVDKTMALSGIRLLRKEGGKSGLYEVTE